MTSALPTNAAACSAPARGEVLSDVTLPVELLHQLSCQSSCCVSWAVSWRRWRPLGLAPGGGRAVEGAAASVVEATAVRCDALMGRGPLSCPLGVLSGGLSVGGWRRTRRCRRTTSSRHYPCSSGLSSSSSSAAPFGRGGARAGVSSSAPPAWHYR